MESLREQAARLCNDNKTDALFHLAWDKWPDEGEAMPDGISEAGATSAMGQHPQGSVVGAVGKRGPVFRHQPRARRGQMVGGQRRGD